MSCISTGQSLTGKPSTRRQAGSTTITRRRGSGSGRTAGWETPRLWSWRQAGSKHHAVRATSRSTRPSRTVVTAMWKPLRWMEPTLTDRRETQTPAEDITSTLAQANGSGRTHWMVCDDF
ncbi:uncharacterized protein LOC144922558 [Branchiostoma floridae x Branchiostoma belcheri]